VDNKIRRVSQQQLDGISMQDCFSQRDLLPAVLHLQLENAPFAMDHGDLAAQNIIVDCEYNITG
jgi:hypothetical protein